MANTATTADRVRDIIRAELLNGDSKPVADFRRIQDDLGADSLDVIELVMEIETAFNISIPDEDIDKLRTVGDFVEYVEQATR